MKRIFRLLLLSVVLIFSSCEEINAIKKENSSDVVKLSVDRSRLVGPNKKRVVLHGVSLGWHNWWSQYYNSGVVKTLNNEWGAHVVRAAMGVEPDGAYLDDPRKAKACVTKVVDAAIENDMYVIIDWHSHSLLLEEAKAFFTEMATKYKGVPNVIYEIFNEPMNLSWPEIKAYSEEVIKTIRGIEPDAIILVAPPNWAQDLNDIADDPIVGEKNIMYTLHFYAATHKDELRAKADYAIKKGLPVFVSECAGMMASGDGPIDVESWNTWYKWMGKNKLSWVCWSISNKDETCSMLLEGANPYGGWTDDTIGQWGKLVKATLTGESYELPEPVKGDAEVKVLEWNGRTFSEKIKPRIEVEVSTEGVSSGEIKVEVYKDTKELLKSETKSYDLTRGYVVLLFPYYDLAPGFYRVKISNNDEVVKEFNFGYEPEKIISKTDRQPDFYDFWEDAKEELSRVDPEYKWELIEEASATTREFYLIKMKSLGGVEVSGYLVIPEDKTKKYPVYVNYQGYGSKPWTPSTHKEDRIDFVFSTRGQCLNEENNTYGDWIVYNLDNKDDYYYRGAYMDLIRSLDFVCSLNRTDQDKVFVNGSSQGGAFTLVAASLDHRVDAAAPGVPFLSDFPDYFKVAPWPGNVVFAAQSKLNISDEDLYRTLSYFDVKNFTESIECPVYMAVGLQDVICPPHTNFAGYNLIKTEKSYHIFPESGHSIDWSLQAPFIDKFFKRYL